MKTEIKFIFYWAIIILLVMNLTAFITVYMKLNENSADKRNESLGFKPGGIRGVVNDLEFNEQQTAEFNQLRNKHMAGIKTNKSSLHFLRTEIIKNLQADVADTNVLDSLAIEYGKLQAEMKKNIFNHFADIKSICNEEQQKVLMIRINDIVNDGMHRRKQYNPNK